MKGSAQLCIALVLMAVTSIFPAQAHNVILNVSKPVYRPGDVINVTALVTNTKGGGHKPFARRSPQGHAI